MTRIILVGAFGRMGRQISELAAASKDYQIVAGVDKSSAQNNSGSSNANNSSNIFDSTGNIPAGLAADVVLDFSHPSALDGSLSFAKERKLPLVIGTTGYTDEQKQRITEAAKTQPIFFAPNMSVGVYAMRQAAALLARSLKEFEIELVETHHNKKLDAPSGTANLLLSDLSRASGQKVSKMGERTMGEIGVHALRGGTVAGIHEVCYFGLHEVVSLKHTAESRQVFASGALVACGFMHTNPAKNGLFGMDECMAARAGKE